MEILASTILEKRKILIIFDNMIADILSNKKLELQVTKLFIRSRERNIFLVMITYSYFAVPKHLIHYVTKKISNKKELQQLAIDYSSNIVFIDFTKIYKKCSFLVNNASLPANNLLLKEIIYKTNIKT